MTERVYCQMVMTTIETSLCEEEQGASECRGCEAATRRCASCGCAGPLAEPVEGCCAECAGRNDPIHQESVLLKDDEKDARPHVMIERLMENVRSIGRPRETQPQAAPPVESVVDARPQPKPLPAETEAAIDRLPNREAALLRQHYGLSGEVPATLEEIAARFGVSRQRAHQMERQALQKLSKALGLDAKSILDLLQDVAKSHVKATRKAIERGRAPRKVMKPLIKDDGLRLSPLLNRLDALLEVISEHAAQSSDGTWKVKEPVRVLMVRAKLLSHEAETTLRSLVAGGRIESAEPWHEARLHFVPSRPNAVAESEEDEDGGKPVPPAIRAGTAQRRRKRAFGRSEESPPPFQKASAELSGGPVVAENVATALPQSPEPLAQPVAAQEATLQPRTGPNPSVSKPAGVTYGAVYAKLLARAAFINQERLVRGAVPLLQTEFRVGPRDVVQVLEYLEAQGRVSPCNGWGTIKLVSESLQDEGLAFVPVALAARKPQKAPHLCVVTDEMAAARPPEPARTPPQRPAVDSLDAAISRLEELLPRLRGTRDEIVARITTLEISLATLRACRQQAAQAEELVERSIRESEKAASELLSLLHASETR